VTLDARRSLGSAKALVGIVEFSDLQCPFCRRFHEGTLRELKARYIDTGKVRLCFRDYPLEGREQSLSAAVAARCAGHQGAFWPMLDALFARQAELGRGLYPNLARGLKLDGTGFRACLASAQESARVRADVRRGRALQIDSTPQFFIGRLSGDRLASPTSLVGAQPIESFQKIIEPLLRP